MKMGRDCRGFTLLELMIVIVLIGMLAGMVVVMAIFYLPSTISNFIDHRRRRGQNKHMHHA